MGAGTACRPQRAATEGSAFGYRKPLKRLDPNFKKSVGLLPCSFCGDPGGRIVQVISLREITCCSCGEALLSPNVPPTISQGIPYVALFATCGGSIPPLHQHKEHGCCRALCVGEADDWMSKLLAIFSISSDVGMLIGLSSKVRISLI